MAAPMTSWVETIVDGRSHAEGYYHASARCACTVKTREPWAVALRRWPTSTDFADVAPLHELTVTTRAHATALMQSWVRDRALLGEVSGD